MTLIEGWPTEMNHRTLDVLEYAKVKLHIRHFTASSLGKTQIEQMCPFQTFETANRDLQAVDEALQFILRLGTLPFGGITDIRANLSKAAIGGTLSSHDLLSIAAFIAGGRNVRQAIDTATTILNIPLLVETILPLFDARRTEQEIRQAIDEDGGVLDHASPELRRIRNELRSAKERVRHVLEQLLRSKQKLLQENVIAMRGDSYCLAVRVEFKNQVRGIIRDYSASGSTVFIEPQEVIDASEKIRMRTVEEEREIERILHQLSGVVAGVARELEVNACLLGQFDAWFAKASYARAEQCSLPRLNQEGIWNLRRARHPLIAREEAVPIDVGLGRDYRMLIVTGPNTGGKTVTLKTIGICTLLAMSGCFIPAAEGSEIGWCKQIYADIGDEQSIEQSLSTFSSHMRNIVRMFGELQSGSLVLLDELGAGTDPLEGAALAIAILDELKARGATVVATTHYAELKGYAFTEPTAMNASVEFDVETLRPTYKLLVGIPGRSNALAIANRLGLDPHIIEKAKSVVKTGDIRVEDLIAQMETARKTSDELRAQSLRERDEASKIRAELEHQKAVFEANVERAENNARAQAKAIVERAEAEATRVIEELRQRQKHGAVKDHELVALRKSLELVKPSENTLKRRAGSRASVTVGAIVRVVSLQQKGEVVEKAQDGKTVTVQLGGLRMKVDTHDVEILQQKAPSDVGGTTKKTVSKDIRMEIDVRGETVDDALLRIDKYLDDAVLSGLRRIVVIHGKGTGTLRDAVRRHVSRHRQVASYQVGGHGEGGDGVTVLEVKA